jgi:HlyD family secretion protein
MKNALLLAFITISIFSASGCGKPNTDLSNSNTGAGSSKQAVDVTTATVVSKEIPSYFEATGTLASDAQTDVAPTVGGKITEVNFDVGSYVTKGSVLIRLDPRDAQIRLEQAERQTEQAYSQVEQVKATVKQAEAAVGQAKAVLRQNQIRLGLTEGSEFNIEKFSQVLATKAQLAFAEKELVRAEKLFSTGDQSRSIRDQKLSIRDQLLGQLEESKSNAAVAIKAINSAQEGVKTAQAQVATAQANVRSAQAAANTSKSSVDQARKSLNDTAVYAPISGYISERVSDVGEFISPNTPNAKICTILRTAILRLKVDVPEQNISLIKVGQSVSMKVAAYPERNFAGTIARMLPNVNPTSRTLTVEAEVESDGGTLKPGLFATVRIAQSKPEMTIIVPATSVRTDGGVSKVFVIADGRAVEKIVQLGDTEGDNIQIKRGLNVDEKIATSNVSQLFDGVNVRQ